MADLPTGGKYYTELPETTSFTDDDKIFMLNEGYGELATVNSLVDVVAQKAGAQGVVSDQFDTLKSYSKGDYCIYDNVLYKFTTDKEMGSWDESVVEQTTIGAEVSELNSDLIVVESVQTTSFSISSESYASATIPASKDGYTPIGIVGFYSSNTRLFFYRAYIDGSDAVVNLRNIASVDYTDVTITAYVLYKRD